MIMLAPHIAAWALNKRNTSAADHNADVVVGIDNTPKVKKQRKRRVLQTKGGGGYVPPPQPTAQEQAEAREWEAAKEFERETRREETQAQKDKTAKEASDAAWLSSKNAAYQGAKSGAANRLNAMGLSSGDQYGVWDQVQNRYDTANNALQTGADYSGAFNQSIVDEILGTARTGQRNKYSTAFNTNLSPYYAEDEFGDTADDAILNSILTQQYDDAMADLTASRERGATNEAVYNRALRDLGTARATANTDLQNLGRGVRENIIGDVGSRRKAALDLAANWDFGSSYDPTAEADRIRSYAGGRKTGLEGELRGAVGGKEYFDVNSLLGRANAKVGNQSTGTTGTGASALYDTFENEAKRNTENIKASEGTF